MGLTSRSELDLTTQTPNIKRNPYCRNCQEGSSKRESSSSHLARWWTFSLRAYTSQTTWQSVQFAISRSPKAECTMAASPATPAGHSLGKSRPQQLPGPKAWLCHATTNLKLQMYFRLGFKVQIVKSKRPLFRLLYKTYFETYMIITLVHLGTNLVFLFRLLVVSKVAYCLLHLWNNEKVNNCANMNLAHLIKWRRIWSNLIIRNNILFAEQKLDWIYKNFCQQIPL